MQINTFTQLSIRIIAIFIILMLVSFIPDYLHGFFGDEYCKVPNHWYAGGLHNTPTWHWGYRHWLFIIMGVVLFIVQVVHTIHIFDKKKF